MRRENILPLKLGSSKAAFIIYYSWNYFPHDHARSRAYRWGEDGLLGVTDRQCRLCLSVALWNGKDPILKERLFGLTGNQVNLANVFLTFFCHFRVPIQSGGQGVQTPP